MERDTEYHHLIQFRVANLKLRKRGKPVKVRCADEKPTQSDYFESFLTFELLSDNENTFLKQRENVSKKGHQSQRQKSTKCHGC